MKLSMGIIIALIIGYALARYFPAPGNMIGLP